MEDLMSFLKRQVPLIDNYLLYYKYQCLVYIGTSRVLDILCLLWKNVCGAPLAKIAEPLDIKARFSPLQSVQDVLLHLGTQTRVRLLKVSLYAQCVFLCGFAAPQIVVLCGLRSCELCGLEVSSSELIKSSSSWILALET